MWFHCEHFRNIVQRHRKEERERKKNFETNFFSVNTSIFRNWCERDRYRRKDARKIWRFEDLKKRRGKRQNASRQRCTVRASENCDTVFFFLSCKKIIYLFLVVKCVSGKPEKCVIYWNYLIGATVPSMRLNKPIQIRLPKRICSICNKSVSINGIARRACKQRCHSNRVYPLSTRFSISAKAASAIQNVRIFFF